MDEITWIDIGKRIALARSIRDITQSELASRIDLGRTAIAKIESGNRGISAIELVRVASVLAVPVSWFMTSSYPAIVSHREGEAVSGLDGEIQLRLETLGLNLELLFDLRQLNPIQIDREAIDPPTSYHEAEQAAIEIRRRLGNQDEPFFNLNEAAEQLGLYSFVFDMDNESFDGAYLSLPTGGIALINGFHEPGRRRFTLSHEIGHHVFQDEYVSDWTIGNTTSGIEKLINAFAVYFLLPRQGVIEQWNRHNGASVPRSAALNIAVEYQVSWSALCAHLKNLELIDEEMRVSLSTQNPGRGELLEQGLVILNDLQSPSIPTGYSAAVVSAYRKNMITAERVIELLFETITEEELPVPDTIPLKALVGQGK